jgi:hypothetical protein
MGFLKGMKDMKDTFDAAQAAALAANPPPPPPPLTILNPSPQDVIDQLLAAGGVARGVVVGGRNDMSDGDRPVRTRVRVRVRPRLQAGQLGEETEVKAWVGWKVATLLEPGLEIPVLIDRATNRVTDIETGQLADELAPRSDEAKRRHKGWDLDTGLEGISELPGAVKDFFKRSGPGT